MPTATNYGTAQNKTAAATVVVTTTAIIPAGTLLVIGVCADNVAAATPTISSITTVGGGTWTDRTGATTQSGATSTAGSGVFVYCQTLYATSQIASGTAITVTFNASPVAKAVALWGFDGMGQNVLRGTVASAASTVGTPSVATSGTAPVADDVVIGIIGTENSAIATGDADTLNGSWSAISGIASSGGAANTNTAIGMQYKVVTAGGAQTFNPTGGVADSVAIVFTLVRAQVAPTAPSLTNLVTNTATIVSRWTPDINTYPIPTVSVDRSTDNVNFTTIATGQPDSGSYTFTGLSPGQSYWFRLSWTNSVGTTPGATYNVVDTSEVIRQNTLEGGTLGATFVAAAQYGVTDAGGDSISRVLGPITYDNTHVHSGNLAAKALDPTWAAIGWAANQLGYRPTYYWRCYLYLTAYPTSNLQIISGIGGPTTNVSLTTTGKLSVVSGAGVSTNSVPLNAWFRLEGVWTSGTSSVRLFNSPESVTPTETVSVSTPNADTYGISIGLNVSGSTLASGLWIDDIALQEHDWLGPYVPPQPPRNIHLSNAALQPAFTR